MSADVIEVLFPPVCVACSRLLRRPGALPLCTACAPEAVPLPEAARRGETTALFAYEGALARAVTRLKFGGQPALAGPLGRLLAAGLGPTPAWEQVVAAPLHPLRAFVRGYDQAGLLAAHLVRAWPSTPRPRLLAALRRTRPTLPQTDLDRRARLANVQGAFLVPERARPAVAGRRVLVIDDVTTTGATLAACRAALLAAGAAEVGGLALLRALP